MIEHQASPAAGEWEDHSPVVVGVDGSERNRAAIAWAAQEAGRSGCDLRLVGVSELTLIPHLSHPAPRSAARHAVDDALETAKQYVGPEHLASEVASGPVEEALLERSAGARLLVVGKRGRHAIPRMLVGSTSLAVAGRSPVPVAVVPDSWDQRAHEHGAVVVGVHPDQPASRLLHLAFHRAHRLKTPLVVVHGREQHDDVPVGTEAEPAALEGFLEAWRHRFPEVEVSAHDRAGHPAVVVLDAAADAQLVILGRRNSSRFSGFGFGSVTRAVLHYAECPVLVVPTDAD
ncbi:universal stress protein [Nocardioides mesophilus]|uniref:Universal stress protein n=1 Tax=Nocardioides mesophilus TaxID=433659 RepID=A0A7G9R7E8_9ACTN|nr:universal stress protein [Nocardioides mesophilus]QNN51523.1 universal stress protein [Nocardioides mesophilus]